MSDPTVNGTAEGHEVRHERSDVESGGIVGFAVGLVVSLVAIAIVLGLMVRGYLGYLDTAMKTQYPLSLDARDQLPPSPRLEGLAFDQSDHDLGRLRPSNARVQTNQEDGILAEGGAVAGEAGFAREPIAEAMRQVLSKGLLRSRPGTVLDEYLAEPSEVTSGRTARGGPAPKPEGDKP